MATAYSEDLRKRALNMITKGENVLNVSKIFQISRASLFRWMAQKKRIGSLAPKKNWQNGYGHKITDLEMFKKFADENLGLTAIEMAKKWGNITPKTIRKWLHRIGYSKKKDLWIQGTQRGQAKGLLKSDK